MFTVKTVKFFRRNKRNTIYIHVLKSCAEKVTKLTVFYLADIERGDNVNYFEAYRDCWNFHKEHSKVLDSDEYWKGVVGKSGEIAKKYDNSKFVRDIC